MRQSWFRSNSTGKSSAAIKLVALLLMVGGIVGVVFAVSYLNGRDRSPMLFAEELITILVFGWSALKGRDLWNGKPAGYKWARILVVTQIPVIGAPGFSYWFYTGLSCRLYFQTKATAGSAIVASQFNLGSSVSLLIGQPTEVVSVGINLVAVAALVCLLAVSPQHVADGQEDMINPT